MQNSFSEAKECDNDLMPFKIALDPGLKWIAVLKIT